jgi:hypothetical protein
VAFWTEMSAIATTQTAIISNIKKFANTFKIITLKYKRCQKCRDVPWNVSTVYPNLAISPSMNLAIWLSFSGELVSMYTLTKGSVPEGRSNTQLPSSK